MKINKEERTGKGNTISPMVYRGFTRVRIRDTAILQYFGVHTTIIKNQAKHN